jgi:ferrous-iron efflux pump FieF
VFLTLGLGKLLQYYSWSMYIDPIGSVFVACFLLFSAYQVFVISVRDLLDCSISPCVLMSVNDVLESHVDKYRRIREIRSRKSGSIVYIEIFAEFNGDGIMRDVQAGIDHICNSLQERIPNSHVLVMPVSE